MYCRYWSDGLGVREIGTGRRRDTREGGEIARFDRANGVVYDRISPKPLVF